ncbi:MAG: MlaC/ttg2D family ABC transporter substrate-binding protein [Dongiaceae bacterium]
MNQLRVMCLVFLACITVAAGAPARADQAADGAVRFIESLGTKAIGDLTGDTLSVAERETRFRALLSEHFDMPAINKFVLGRYWRVATDQEKTEFSRLFEEFLVKSYAIRFAGYAGQSFEVLGGGESHDGVVIVNSRIDRNGAEPIRLDWRVIMGASRMTIVDILIEGVSMAVTQRSDFASVIQSRGGTVAGLLEALRDKAGGGEQSVAQ